jgi:hypothetical protein
MDFIQFHELKQKLLHDRDLAPVWRYFLNHFAEQPGFMELGEQARNVFVEAVIDQVGIQLYGNSSKVRDLILRRLDDQRFVHGGFMVDGRVGGVIFFEDAHIGLVTVAELPPSIDVKYARFSGQPARKVPVPSNN